MVCELEIIVGSRKTSSSLIHFLCTYPTMQCRGYASKLIQTVFQQEAFQNKSVYAVTQLHEFHEPSLIGIDTKCEEVKNSEIMQHILKLPKNDSSGFFKKFQFSLKKRVMVVLLINVIH